MKAELFLLYLSIFASVACSSSKLNKTSTEAPKIETQPRYPIIEKQSPPLPEWPTTPILPPAPPVTVLPPPLFGHLKAIIIKTGPKGFEPDVQGDILIRICDRYRETKPCCSTTRIDNSWNPGDFKANRNATFKDSKTLYTCLREYHNGKKGDQFEVQLTPQLPKIILSFQRGKSSRLDTRWSANQVILKFDSDVRPVRLICDHLEDFGLFGPDPRTVELTQFCELKQLNK